MHQLLSVATVLALGADFLGTTSALLGNLPPDKVDGLQYVNVGRRGSIDAGMCCSFPMQSNPIYTRLDVLYPIRGFKRFVNKDGGYEFRYPKVRAAGEEVKRHARPTRTTTICVGSIVSSRDPYLSPLLRTYTQHTRRGSRTRPSSSRRRVSAPPPPPA